MPGFDIFNFLLPRDQVDDIPNLDVDILRIKTFIITFKLIYHRREVTRQVVGTCLGDSFFGLGVNSSGQIKNLRIVKRIFMREEKAGAITSLATFVY